ncbi:MULTISPECIES: DNA repair protein RecN [unclassified Eubacterium (in: firmicutes)]|uniref:DNA repair protein RecN n=1 Tax=unclassified Eubacterium (in: firmicutes) TaxID=2624479 RepID=UPI000339D66E|nr:DNA repair protein RecN [Eubacterium sp. AF17-7]RGG64506.1 DNA repair protein RecN [Eubacterium sp. AF17-7]CDA29694.1 dNA repair protein RecN [Eubacterium sp. CAG:156]
MLLNLHVKNLALIKEVDVDFTNGLVVLTGETGAGKSLILGSVNIALGKKVEKDIIRKGAEYALVELTFCIDSRLKEKLEQYDVYPEDENIIVVSRKITYGRSVSKINGETVSLTTLKNVMDLLIDIHGQHDHQSLLYKNTHLQILDKYAGEEVKELKNTISDKYSQYIEIKKELDKFDMDETKRLRECEFAEFEINEIEAANLSLGEDDEVENEFKKLSGSEKIMSSLSDAYQIMGYEGNQGVCECISRVGYDLSEISDIDSKLSDLQKQIYDIDDMCKGLAREISDYIDEVNYEPQRVAEVEERLNLINHLKLKYGQSIEKILAYKGEKQAYLDSLNNYNLMREETKTKLDKEMSELVVLCDKLSSLRKKYAIKLEETVVKALEDLNFLSVKFKINVSKKENVSANGQDEVEFLISTNPGEEVKSLAKVASGGELSRIMLAIKSILAGEDEIDTMIFDEIDTGISGKTAQMVADKLMGISKEHQVICISHLAQIAAMADSHYLIEKNTDDESTETNIYRLSREDSIKELVRISSGGEITETAIKHATEMKEMAERAKLGQF